MKATSCHVHMYASLGLRSEHVHREHSAAAAGFKHLFKQVASGQQGVR